MEYLVQFNYSGRVTYVLADEVCFIESKSTSNGGSEPKAKASTKKANVDVATDDDDLPF